MHEKEKKDSNKDLEDDVEDELDNLWNNWASRRKCESTHTPEFIKKKDEKKDN